MPTKPAPPPVSPTERALATHPDPHFAQHWDPRSPEQHADPYPGWDALAGTRPTFTTAINPVVPGATATQQPSLLVLRHADVLEVLRQPRTFETPESVNPRLPPVPDRLRARLPDGWPWEGSMLFGSEQWNRPVARKATAQTLTGAAIANRLPRVRHTADRLLDTLAPHGRGDLIADFCHPYVIRMLALDVIGLEQDGLPLAQAFCEESQTLFLAALGLIELTDAQLTRIAEHQAECREYVLSIIAARKAHPTGDLISELLSYKDAAIPERDILKVTYHVLLALDQPVLMIGNIIHYLLADPSRWQEVLDDRARIPAIVDECMRLLNTLPILQTRIATHDTHIGGVDVPKHTIIALHAGAANRDPARFQDASAYCPGRADAAETLTFGKWSHFCIGSKLARQETVIAIDAIAVHLPGLRLTELAPPRTTGLFSGFRGLPIAWDTTPR